jgi:hypothetical protein
LTKRAHFPLDPLYSRQWRMLACTQHHHCIHPGFTFFFSAST